VTVTQLYLSVDAPDKETLKKVDVPLFSDYWERLNQSLEYCKEKKYRTAVRLTCVKNVNMENLEGYKELILKAEPDFIEIKGYMHVGASRQRLNRENMPSHIEIKEFGLKLLEFLPDYVYESEHIPSRVILLTKKKWHKNTWIDFDKFFELVNATTKKDKSKKQYPKNLNSDLYAIKPGKAPEKKKDNEMGLD
jgi:tRNA wybutosine-synthesizing protein 1